MQTFTEYVSQVFKTQSDLVDAYLNQKRTTGEIISNLSYNKAKSSMLLSTKDSFMPIPFNDPFIPNVKFSSYLLLEFLNSLTLNFQFLSKALSTCADYIDETSSHYDALISQAQDNFNKLLAVKDFMAGSSLNTELPMPTVPSIKTVSGKDFLVPQQRGEGTVIKSLSPDSVFPLRIECSSQSIIKNYDNGFSIAVEPKSDLYRFQFRHSGFSNREGLMYFIELANIDGAISYRASADNTYFGEWRTLYNYHDFFPIVNDFGEGCGIEFRLIPRDTGIELDPDWFIQSRVHVIQVTQSTDYGMVKECVFKLKTPTVLNNIRVINFDTTPFIVERVDASLDNINYFKLSSYRGAVLDGCQIAAPSDVPVKYIKLLLKQESYSTEYKRLYDLNAVLNKAVVSNSPSDTSSLFKDYYFDLGYKYIKNNVLRDKILSLLRSKNIDEYSQEKVYNYRITVATILVNGLNLIQSMV